MSAASHRPSSDARATPFGPPLLIANPRAGRGRDPVLPRLQAALRERGLPHDAVVTDGPGHATELAHDAVEREGRRFVVAVGGDGTVHEVVGGVCDPATGVLRGDDPVLGIVAGGTGCDLARTFGIDRGPTQAARHLEGETTVRIDLGRATVTDRHGDRRTVIFANVAEAGYGGLVVDLANRLPRRLGTTRYAAAVLGAAWRMRTIEATVTLDHTELTEPVTNVVIANGQFFGGGMKVAPQALPDDGRFDVQVWRGRPADVLRTSSQLRLGEHIKRPEVRAWRSTTLAVDGSRPMAVEADGEVLGTTPARFDLLPGAIRLKL